MKSSDLIDRAELVNYITTTTIKTNSDYDRGKSDERANLLRFIKRLPSHKLLRAKTKINGVWKNDNVSDINSSGKYKLCSKCKKSTFILLSSINGSRIIDYNYCPHCGAEMLGVD